MVDLNFTPGSAMPISVSVSSIYLFYHINFGGYSKKYTESDRNINSDFPAGDDRGASSFIVINSSWKVFMDEDFKGSSAVLSPGFYKTYAEAKLKNDKAQSIMKVD